MMLSSSSHGSSSHMDICLTRLLPGVEKLELVVECIELVTPCCGVLCTDCKVKDYPLTGENIELISPSERYASANSANSPPASMPMDSVENSGRSRETFVVWILD